ncbi:hypothetical protein LguiB_021138 [Lonicera macranthoides]
MAAAVMALTFASLASLRLLKRAMCGTAANEGVLNTSSPTPSYLFSLSPFLSSPQQIDNSQLVEGFVIRHRKDHYLGKVPWSVC